MALILEITKADGTVARTALQNQTTKVGAWPGGKVRVIDSATGKSPPDITATKVGDSLIVDGLPEGKKVEVTKFYTDCSPNAPCSVVIDPADGGQAVPITQTSQPIAALPDNQALMYGPTSDAAAAAPAPAASSGIPTGALLGGLALLGVAAAAGGGGGGGGGGSSTPPPDTTAPNSPVVASVAGDNVVSAAEAAAGVAVSGTAEAGSTVTVTWGSTTKTATADGSGNWSANFASGEVPADGNTTISATARDAAGNTSAAGTLAVAVDTGAPSAPTVANVAGDNVVNAAEATAGVAVSGTAEAGSTVEVTWGSTTKTATADGSGNWSANFASGEVPADGATQISATATDAAGNASSASGPLDVAVDKTLPAAPSAVAGLDGSVSGTAEANSTVKLGAAETTADGSGNYQFAAGTLASGATGSVTATDAAGNAGSGTDVTAGTYTLGTAGADTILGGDLGFVGGGAGSDILIGGAGGGVRNYQFEYWNATDAGDVLYNQGGGSLVTFSPSASTGWTIVSDTTSIVADPGGTAVEQFTGGGVNAGMNLVRQDAGVGVEDDTGGGARYAFDTVRNPTSGGTTISQAIATGEGTEYTLSMQVSDNDYDTSLGVYWGGTLVGLYDGVTDSWSGTAPTETDLTGSRKTWSWTVEGSADPTTTLEIRAYSTTADDGQGMMIDRVTLDAVTPDGAETMAGGAGSDLLFGQAGNDTLYGGALGDVAATADGVADAFVYSMRADNGNDVIKDFKVGVDRIYLVDSLDTYTTDSGIPPFENPDNGTPFVNNSDANLTFRDFVQADSAGQYLTVTDDGSGSVKLTFFGQDSTGAATALGSVVLEGTEFGAGAGQYDTVEELFTGGVLVATMDGFNPAAPIV